MGKLTEETSRIAGQAGAAVASVQGKDTKDSAAKAEGHTGHIIDKAKTSIHSFTDKVSNAGKDAKEGVKEYNAAPADSEHKPVLSQKPKP